ncbi:MAG: hypothetical protein ACPHM3_01130 [Candidatus Kariarchaeum pelagius]
MHLKKYVIIAIFIVTIFSVGLNKASAQNMEPEIINNNSNYIEEYVNPIILNWTVIDDNLVRHEIYVNNILINEKDYNWTGLNSEEILSSFYLEVGEYNISILVIDTFNETKLNQMNLLKGYIPSDIPKLFVHISPISIIMIVLFSRYQSFKKHKVII